jgi:hypothetical protein
MKLLASIALASGLVLGSSAVMAESEEAISWTFGCKFDVPAVDESKEIVASSEETSKDYLGWTFESRDFVALAQ